jgi:hypothetical protein
MYEAARPDPLLILEWRAQVADRGPFPVSDIHFQLGFSMFGQQDSCEFGRVGNADSRYTGQCQ